MKVKYHKHCYRDYLRLPRNSATPAGRPPNKIPHYVLIEAFEKLIDKIKYQLTSHSFEVSLLAKRLAQLTEIEDAVLENRVMKSLLIDKYGGNVLFLYSSDRSKSSFVFMGNIPLDEVIEHIRTINSTNYIVQVAKQLRKEILRTEVIPDGLQYSQTENNFCRPSTNSLPGWTPFQQILSSETSAVSTVGFSPIIPQPPTSKDVVYTAMKNYVNVTISLYVDINQTALGKIVSRAISSRRSWREGTLGNRSRDPLMFDARDNLTTSSTITEQRQEICYTNLDNSHRLSLYRQLQDFLDNIIKSGIAE
ncbi:unnamed protein product [Brassicogethes aeneus]|uniref:Uncharacterized protein n=1 Tax=Brassicogethes aeneus TaxID=1431903 RepID=A0A9P0BJM5_BRAAE|nr:unnamed protein product [Brassicogethes aeneus]